MFNKSKIKGGNDRYNIIRELGRKSGSNDHNIKKKPNSENDMIMNNILGNYEKGNEVNTNLSYISLKNTSNIHTFNARRLKENE